MAINFPNSPTNGQIFTSGGKSYEYNSTTGVWNRRPEATSPIPADVSDLTDTTNLLFDGQYSSLTGAPTSSTAGALGTLTKTFTQNEETEITLSENISPVPNVSVFKEIPQSGVTSKGNWDVNANATNYEFFDEKPISYASTTLTPSATGDGTFTLSSGSFDSADVGKKVVGNSGSAIITSTTGAYKSVTPFADTSAISSWQLYGAEGKSDGTGIQLAGIAVNDVYNLSTASNDNKTFNAQSQLTGAQGIAFKDDGTAMYLVGYTNDTVYQYTLSTAWDVSTASYASKSFSVAAQDAVPRDIRFKSDGTSFYIIASTAPDSIYQYDLSTAWDISTASYSNKSFSVQTQSINPAGLAVSADGTKFYVSDYGSAVSYQYDLSTAWDISTASYSNKSLTSTTQGGQMESIDISSDGLKFFMSNTIDDAIFQYDLSTAWDLSTASTSHSASLSPTDLGMEVAVYNGWYNIVFSPTGHKLYTFGNHDEIVYQISTGAGVSYTHPYSQYFPALTNSSNGQINSSAWLDINSMTADETKNGGDIFYAVSTDNRTSWGVAKGSDGVRKIARNNSGTWQYNNDAGYGTSETWVNGTNNDEHATLQEALVAQASNRMNKAQLDAVADGYHFSQDSADTLDLMIAPYAASGASPISDGVTINYDAEALVEQAINGTDYKVRFSTANSVSIISLADQNLKIRVI